MTVNMPAPNEDMVPENHELKFPPFPPKEELAAEIKPFEEYETKGVDVPRLPPANEYTDEFIRRGMGGWSERVTIEGSDSHGQLFADLDMDRTPEVAAARAAARRASYNDRHRGRHRVSLEDSWKIGQSVEWEEPHGTCIEDYNISRPPFSRLMDATLAFLDSRFDAFNNKRLKSLFITIRYAFGLKSDFPGLHWPGTGPNGMAYEPNGSARRRASAKQKADIAAGAIGESCPLIRDTEKAVRGFLALARREAEAVWNIDEALVLVDILSAFIAYINYHRVFTDSYLEPAFARAEALARSAPLAIRRSKIIEDAIDELNGINNAGWVLLGGTYLDRQGSGEQTEKDDDQKSDGGWEAPTVTPTPTLSPAEASKVLTPLLDPLPASSVRQLNYLPYARRRVVAVLAPDTDSLGPAFMKTHYRLRTVPAPWTEEEQWRERRQRFDEDEEEEESEGDAAAPVFEQEEATTPEPDELDVWIDPKAIDMTTTDWILGMALRARWAEVGDDEFRWWIVKLKDFVLPSFWQSTEEECAARKDDPPQPFPAVPTVLA